MNIGIKLLVAEDDPNLGTILKAYLTQKGYTVFLAVDGQAALDSYQNDDVDACILDIMMPVKDGFTVAKEIRRVDKRIPIIFLTAKNLEADKLKGFEIGADDYVTKPFSMEELLARLNATIRRSFDDGKPDKNLFHIGNCVFDYSHQTLTCGDNVQTDHEGERAAAHVCHELQPTCGPHQHPTAHLERRQLFRRPQHGCIHHQIAQIP